MEDPSPPGSEVNQHLIWVRGTKIGFDGRCFADSSVYALATERFDCVLGPKHQLQLWWNRERGQH